MLRAAIALVPNLETQNRARRLTFELDERFGTGYSTGLLPPHISLKQTFEIEDLATLEDCFDLLGRQVRPIPVTLGGLEVWLRPQDDTGIAVLGVEPSPPLEELHARLNRELPEALGHPCPAEFDGAYRFHLTVALRGGTTETYRRIERAYEGVRLEWACDLTQLHLFVYREVAGSWEYMDYKAVALA